MDKEPIIFQGFNERNPLRHYKHGILPHWRQDGCTYFVTFRLADSLPQPVLRELTEERHRWLRFRKIDPEADDWKRSFSELPKEEQREYERMVGSHLNVELDRGCGSCVLRQPKASQIVADALEHYHGERVWTGDFVVMPNHIHALMTPIAPYELEDVLKSIKGFSGKEINRLLGASGTLWQRESYDHIVRDTDQLEQFQSYISHNPKKARLGSSDYFLSKAAYEVP